MKKWIGLLLIVVMSGSLIAADYQNADFDAKVLKIQEMTNAVAAQSQDLPLYLSSDKRYFVNAFETAEGDKSEVIYQEWNGSAWVNSERYEFTGSYHYISALAVFIFVDLIDVELIAFLPSAAFLFLEVMMEYLNLDYVLLQESLDGTTWQNVARFTGTLNSSGKIQSGLFETWDGSAWQNDAKIDFAYNGSKQIDNMTLSGMVENTMQEVAKLQQTYTSNNLTRSGLSVKGLAGWNEVVYQTYENNASGNPVIVTQYTAPIIGIGDPSESSRTLYTYNSSQRLICTTSQTAGGGGYYGYYKESAAEVDWTNVSKDTSIFNSKGLASDEIMFSWDGTQWVGDIAFRSTYNSAGDITEFLSQDWDGANWVDTDKDYISYKNGLIDVWLSKTIEGGVETDDFKDTYAYNGSKLTSITSEEYDNGQWVNLDKMLFDLATPVEDDRIIATEFSLGNYPNPFNPSTTITYNLTTPGVVQLNIYDVNGRLIRTLANQVMQSVGSHSVVWDGLNASGQSVASGIYMYELQTSEMTETSRCLLVK